MARTDANGHAYICERRRITGTFLENMELKHFPFDTQVIGNKGICSFLYIHNLRINGYQYSG